ncbi:hypothetical protein SBDP1_930007 [Syntrophobacter sp. SbD1]|nr:hypothetical protein SBDP1_930007 [Syntrophobacter sp. SbD1]
MTQGRQAIHFLEIIITQTVCTADAGAGAFSGAVNVYQQCLPGKRVIQLL